MANDDERLPFAPPHPGDVLREDILRVLNNMKCEGFGRAFGCHPPIFVSGHSRAALRIGGNGPALG